MVQDVVQRAGGPFGALARRIDFRGVHGGLQHRYESVAARKVVRHLAAVPHHDLVASLGPGAAQNPVQRLLLFIAHTVENVHAGLETRGVIAARNGRLVLFAYFELGGVLLVLREQPVLVARDRIQRPAVEAAEHLLSLLIGGVDARSLA